MRGSNIISIDASKMVLQNLETYRKIENNDAIYESILEDKCIKILQNIRPKSLAFYNVNVLLQSNLQERSFPLRVLQVNMKKLFYH